MDTKRTWGFISLLLGSVSLLWGGIAFGGLLGQSMVTADMGSFIAQGGGDYLHAFNPEHAIAEVKNRYQYIATTGLVLTLIGGMMMRGQWGKRW